jgi:hypothetical protein
MTLKPVKLLALIFIAMGMLLSSALVRPTTQVQAQDVSPALEDRFMFGLVGITSGQTLRVNVANTLVLNDTNLPAGPSRVVINLLNARGQLVRHRDGSLVRRVALVERGESTFLEFDGDEIPGGPDRRLPVRAVVSVFPPGPTVTGKPYDSATPSIEIFNNSNGHTQVFIGNPGVIRGFNPQPDPPLAQ